MKRRFFYGLLVAALALIPFIASAQGTVNNSGFQVQNLSDTAVANITVRYYSEASGAEAASQTQAVPAGGSVTFLNGQNGTVNMAAPTGFRGSVVISSDQPVAAITNLLGTNIGSSYSGFTSGAATVSLPLIARNNPVGGGQTISTSFSVQNTGTSAVTVNINYTPGIAGSAGATDTATIQPGASKSFFQSTKTELGGRFVGSATVTASTGGSVAVTVQQEGNTQLLSYDGFTGGSSSVAIPLIAANNFGNFTGVQVQNGGATATNVTVTYAPNTITTASDPNACGTPPATTFSLAGGASKTLIQANGPTTEGFDPFFAKCRYVGGATISNAGGQPLFAIVNQVNTASKNASAYEGFNPTATTSASKAPLVFANNFGLFSGVQVQNTGTTDTSVTIAYGPNNITGGPSAQVCGTPTARTQPVKAGASFTFIQSGAGTSANGFDDQFKTCRYVGAATISAASGGKVVAIVNQVSGTAAATADTLFTYNSFNQ